MKRSILTLLTLALSAIAFAQDREVTGTVTNSANGSALPGVNVILRGTTNGTTTDAEGKFRLMSPADGTLIFSFIGMTTREVPIGAQTEFTVALDEDSKQLSEVVVTALGIQKSRQSLGYALQDVKGEQLAEARSPNVVNALSGKIAGVRISPNSGPGSGSSVQIRGQSSLGGNNQPLYVIDGVPMEQSQNQGKQFGGGITEVSPDNIAEISVLKGPSATALYGSRGQNGVILITTKNGSGTKGLMVEVNSNVSFERPAVKPDFQNIYAGGNGYRTWYTNGRSAGITDPVEAQQYRDAYGTSAPLTGTDGTDESWGAPMDGRLVRHWWTGTDVAPLVPMPDNWDDYWETGTTITNNIAVGGSGDRGSFRVSLGDLKQDGIMYNNDYWRKNLKLNTIYDFTDKLSATISAEYVKAGSDNRSYQDGQQFIWSHRQTDWEKLKHYNDYRGVHIQRPGDGDAPNWQHTFFVNPFMVQDILPYSNEKDRILGNVAINYQIVPSLNVTLRSGTDLWTDTRINVINYERVRNGTQVYGQYSEEVLRGQETNTDVMMTFSKNVTPAFSLNAMAGALLRTTYYKRNFTQVNQLVVDRVYNLSNSIPASNTAASTIEEKESQSIFGSAQLGYKDAIYLDLTARNDWSSTLPKTNWSYFYPSVGLSAIVTQLIDLSGTKLSFAKVRASWAQVGNDTDPYRLKQTYLSASSWNGAVPEFYENIEIANSTLKPEMTTGIELGFEAKLFSNRLGVDFTYYDQSTKDQILAVEISKASGYNTRLLNAGEITNKGIEVVLNVTPVRLANGLTWDVTFNFAKNQNKVVALADGLTTYQLAARNSLASLASVGEPYGALFGIGFERAPDGNILYKDGLPVVATKAKILGNIQPDWTGGMLNTIGFKGITLSALIDVRMGGDVYNEGIGIARWTGQYAETAVGREEGIIGEGTMNIGTTEDPVYVPNDIIVPAQSLYAFNNARTRHEASIFDASYVKLREVSLGYTLPPSLLKNIFIKSVKVSAVGRNLAILFKNIPHIDPEFDRLGGNSYGFGYGELPTTRSMGFNVNMTF
ncbi:MAG TPA: SusC/RagA family TonB-linked outer membrane protein [Chryseosolibacter sp.]